MTRKDYVAIAQAFNAEIAKYHPTREGYHAAGSVAFRLADVLAADNSRFDRARFLKACGVQS